MDRTGVAEAVDADAVEIGVFKVTGTGPCTYRQPVLQK
jgi:hypothetical protein